MTPRLPLVATAALVLTLASAPAHAALPSGNIVQNGGAETGPGATNDTDFPAVPNWQTTPNFTAVAYGTGQFPTQADSAGFGGGNNFFAGGPDNGFGQFGGGSSVALQEIDLSGAAAEIDAGNVQATLSVQLGGFDTQEDGAQAAAFFTNADGSGSTVLFAQPPTAQERGGRTGFVRRTHCTTLPPGVRRAEVSMLTQRQSGSYNDAYIDNLSVTLSTDRCVEPLPPPAPPQPRETANAEPVSGRILIRKPGSNEFQELSDESSIPVGSEIDASKGVVQLETAADSAGSIQTAKFFDSSFVMTQTRGSRPITDLRLTGGQIDKCPRRASKVSAAGSRRTRRLWGDGRGRFRTRGRYASATVRGTRWSVKDTCTATTVTVRRGSVTVRDLVKRRNFTLKAPKQYVARPRQR